MSGPDREVERGRPTADDRQERVPAELATPADQLLALNTAAGNRAVSRLLANAAGRVTPSTGVLQRKPVQVRTKLTEPMTGNRIMVIKGAYEVEFSLLECTLTIKARIVPDRNVTAAQVAQVKADTAAAFEQFWDGKFYLDDTRSKERFFLRVKVKYVNSGGHTRIRLRAGAGTDNQTTWFVNSIPIDRAHELSHQLGLRDEYIDARVNRRRTNRARSLP